MVCGVRVEMFRGVLFQQADVFFPRSNGIKTRSLQQPRAHNFGFEGNAKKKTPTYFHGVFPVVVPFPLFPAEGLICKSCKLHYLPDQSQVVYFGENNFIAHSGFEVRPLNLQIIFSKRLDKLCTFPLVWAKFCFSLRKYEEDQKNANEEAWFQRICEKCCMLGFLWGIIRECQDVLPKRICFIGTLERIAKRDVASKSSW